MVGTATALQSHVWIGDLEVLGHLSRGGMADLYRGRRYGVAGFSRDIAIKVLRDELAADERFLCMFYDEGRISARLSHPNIVRVEELGCAYGRHYLAMEFIDGCSVNDLLRMIRRTKRVLAPDVAVHIAMGIAEGLHAAHEARDDQGHSLDLIHRDISPSNVLLSRNGHVKVIDFGIAKAHGRLGATQTGHCLKGKLRYMAPEQAIGNDLDRRADLYSLGVVLWELLAGRQLFAANTEVELFERITNPQISAPSTYNAQVPMALDELTLSLLSTRPDDRPATAEIVRRRLRDSAPGLVHCDAQSIARLVDAAENDDNRIPEVQTPVVPVRFHSEKVPSLPALNGAPRRTSVVWQALLALSGTAVAVVAGMWISAAIGVEATQVEDGFSLSGEKTDRSDSLRPTPTTPEGETVIQTAVSKPALKASKPVATPAEKVRVTRKKAAKRASTKPVATKSRRARRAPKRAKKSKPIARSSRRDSSAAKLGSVVIATDFD